MPLHPFIENMLAAAREAKRPALSAGSPADARASMAASRPTLGPALPMREVRNLAIPTRSGAIDGRLLVPEGEVDGLIIYFHGGGWVIGAIDDFDTLARALAQRAGCAILLPEYRLAPEHPFPAALEDAEDTCRWARAQLESLIGKDAPIIVAGDSAGGNLAAVCANTLRGEMSFALQALLYPVVDCDLTRPSYAAYGSGLILNTPDMEWFFDHYVPRELRTNPRVSPIRETDLFGTAPALVLTAEYDVLRDEGEAYAAALSRSGVAATHHRVDGLTHGFIRLHNHVDEADEALTKVAAACAAAVAG